jgi:PilZ domain-containing protein
MKRLAVDQEVALSVGDTTIDCRVVRQSPGEVALAPLEPGHGDRLPPASAGASIVFTHAGRLVMLRGAMYRVTGDADLRFAEQARGGGRPVVAEQRRKAARLPITLPATIRVLDEDGAPFGEERQLVTRDVSIGGFAVATGVGGFSPGVNVEFELILTSGETITGTATVVRAASEMSGLRFQEIPAAARVRLAGFLAGRQSGRGPRATASG